MNGIPTIRYGYFPNSYSRDQTIQSSQISLPSQNLTDYSPALMISIFYIGPMTLLVALCLIPRIKRKLAFRKQIQQLSHTAALERMYRLKTNVLDKL
jgi:hypothetical protein